MGAGLGSCFGDFCRPPLFDLDPGFGLEGSIGFRPLVELAVGLSFRYNLLVGTPTSGDFADAETDLSADFVRVGPWFRLYAVEEGLSPALQIGLGYVAADVSSEGEGGSSNALLTGLYFAPGGLLEYRVSDAFTIGISFEYDLIFWQEYCEKDSLGEDCRDPGDLTIDEESLPDFWTLSAVVAYYW